MHILDFVVGGVVATIFWLLINLVVAIRYITRKRQHERQHIELSTDYEPDHIEEAAVHYHLNNILNDEPDIFDKEKQATLEEEQDDKASMSTY